VARVAARAAEEVREGILLLLLSSSSAAVEEEEDEIEEREQEGVERAEEGLEVEEASLKNCLSEARPRVFVLVLVGAEFMARPSTCRDRLEAGN